MNRVVLSGFLSVRSTKNHMKTFIRVFGALVAFNIVMFVINTWCAPKYAVVQTESAVSVPVSAEQKTNQKTYRVAFRVSPVVQSSVKPQ